MELLCSRMQWNLAYVKTLQTHGECLLISRYALQKHLHRPFGIIGLVHILHRTEQSTRGINSLSTRPVFWPPTSRNCNKRIHRRLLVRANMLLNMMLIILFNFNLNHNIPIYRLLSYTETNMDFAAFLHFHSYRMERWPELSNRVRRNDFGRKRF